MLPRPARPFYHEFAWAYDLVIEDDAGSKIDFIAGQFEANGIGKGATILDAGCGTGRYSIALAERGYQVLGLDISEDLLDVARSKRHGGKVHLDFIKGDILELPSEEFDGILCRGVLNDLISEASRTAAIRSLSQALSSNGTLILDVREWAATQRRKSSEPEVIKQVATNKGLLEFSSKTTLVQSRRILKVEERHTLINGPSRTSSNHEFEMRCWTLKELTDSLIEANLEPARFFGGYDSSIPLGSTDRIVAIARKERSPKR